MSSTTETSVEQNSNIKPLPKPKQPTIRCCASTKSGTICKRMVKLPETICTQHQKLIEKKLNPKPAEKAGIERCQCEGKTKENQRCKIIVPLAKYPNKLCYHHQNQIKFITATASNYKDVNGESNIKCLPPVYSTIEVLQEKITPIEQITTNTSVIKDIISVASNLSPNNNPHLMMEDVSNSDNSINSLSKRQRIKNK